MGVHRPTVIRNDSYGGHEARADERHGGGVATYWNASGGVCRATGGAYKHEYQGATAMVPAAVQEFVLTVQPL